MRWPVSLWVSTIRGNATQTTDVLQTQDSSGNIKLRINQHHGLSITGDGLSASDTKGLKITATSASGAASVEMLNSLGGTPSALKLTGPSQSPSNTLLLVNEAAGDVALMTDGIARLTVKESGVIQVTNKITSAQADQLIASAQQIRAILDCGN
jgi:hypothetical protein